MRAGLLLRPTCLNQSPQRFTLALLRRERHSTIYTKCRLWRKTRPPLPVRHITLYSALLSPAAFVALSEEDDADGKTPEEHMLEASRAEIAKQVPENIHGLKRVWRSFILGIDLYIIEPVATALRFFHLIIIFVPVLGATPIIFFGARQKDRDNERTGTLWWYSFLVHSMERAGPAFIKVCFFS